MVPTRVMIVFWAYLERLVTSHASIAYRKQLPPQWMMVSYNRLVGRKTPLPKERWNTYLEPETKTQTTTGKPPAVTATVDSLKASRHGRHSNAVLTESLKASRHGWHRNAVLAESLQASRHGRHSNAVLTESLKASRHGWHRNAVLAESLQASRHDRHRNAVLNESLTCGQQRIC